MIVIGLTGQRDDGGSAGAGKDTVADYLVASHEFAKVALADEMKRTTMRVYDFTIEQLWGPSEKRNEPDLRYPRKHGPFVKKHVGEEMAARLGFKDSTIPVCACCDATADEDWHSLQLFMPEDTAPCFLTPRFALQQLGTEWGRTMFEDTWVAYTLRVVDKLLNDPIYDYLYTGPEGLHDQQPRVPNLERPYKGVVIPDVRWAAGNEGSAIKKAGGRLWCVTRPGGGLKGASGKHKSETAVAPPETFDWIVPNTGSVDELHQRVRAVMAVDLAKAALTKGAQE